MQDISLYCNQLCGEVLMVCVSSPEPPPVMATIFLLRGKSPTAMLVLLDLYNSRTRDSTWWWHGKSNCKDNWLDALHRRTQMNKMWWGRSRVFSFTRMQAQHRIFITQVQTRKECDRPEQRERPRCTCGWSWKQNDWYGAPLINGLR